MKRSPTAVERACHAVEEVRTSHFTSRGASQEPLGHPFPYKSCGVSALRDPWPPGSLLRKEPHKWFPAVWGQETPSVRPNLPQILLLGHLRGQERVLCSVCVPQTFSTSLPI